MNYAIITDNGGGENQIYHDVEGEIYTFPTQYRNILTTGTKVIYHRNKKNANSPYIPNRMLDESHYFGIAEIGTVQPTHDGNLRATITNFKRFQYPVDIHKADGSYYEINPFWQQGVRSADDNVYNSILAASTCPPVAVVHKKGSQGVKSCSSLSVGLSSNPFCQKKYQIVTGLKGYYLKNLQDGIYYELGKVSSFSYKDGTLKILAKKVDPSSNEICFLVRHESYTTLDLGIISLIPNGVSFVGTIDGKSIDVNILL